jgi:predicted ArsR family transcriptional regulator
LKTIKQIADELGVSKTAIRKQITNLGLQSGLQKNGNQFAIDEKQETLILKAFQKKTQTINANSAQTETQTVSSLVCVFQKELDAKNRQLEVKDEQLTVKDRQIEELNARLAETTNALVTAQQTAQAAQALHAGTIRQQIESGGVDPSDLEETPLKKQGFFARVFGRNGK